MDLFSEMIQAVQDDLTVGNETSLVTLAIVKRALNRARRKVEGLFRWPALQDAKNFSIESGTYYYDAPITWRPYSIWRLEIDSVQWGEEPDGSPIKFEDFTQFKADPDFSGSDQKRWAIQWLRVFLTPTPSATGSNNATIWGMKNGAALVADGDTTIFSYNMPEVNEAIVLEACKILRAKGEQQQTGEILSAEAKQIVILAWKRIKEDSAKQDKVQPLFKVPDLFPNRRGGRKDTNIGRF